MNKKYMKKDEDDNNFYKKYPASEIKIIKSASVENVDEEEKQNFKELQELEKLEIQDNANKNENNI